MIQLTDKQKSDIITQLMSEYIDFFKELVNNSPELTVKIEIKELTVTMTY